MCFSTVVPNNLNSTGKNFLILCCYLFAQEGAAAHKAEDNQSPLGQAYQKYLDTLCTEESNAIYNFHVGRMLVIMGNYDDAIKRLEVALSKGSKHEMARSDYCIFQQDNEYSVHKYCWCNCPCEILMADDIVNILNHGHHIKGMDNHGFHQFLKQT